MRIPFYLIVSRSGRVRVNKTPPRLDWDELSVAMELEVPDKLFARPVLQASISIPESIYPESPLNAHVADNVREAIKQATELDFAIRIIEPEEPNSNE